MANEPLHEIQLNGKQLVFLFMSATVVLVVAFLAGVMVGRGVNAPAAAIAGLAGDPLADPTIDSSAEPPAGTGSSSATGSSGPVTAQETLTYAARLEGNEPPEETLSPVAEPLPAATIAAAPPVRDTPPPAAAPATTASRTAVPAAAIASEPAGNGFVVQVAATRERSEADAIARRLSGRGYPAFVTTPASGPRMFRVRVGKYTERREAETVAARLEREEQFKPWITR